MSKLPIQLTLFLLVFFLISFGAYTRTTHGQGQGGQPDGQGLQQAGQGSQPLGQGSQPDDTDFLTLPDPLGGATIEGLLERIVGWLRLIAAPIAAGMIVYGAYQMLFAAGDPEKFKVGRQTILYTVIGYAIIWIAWGITSIIKEFLATAP